MVRVLTPEQARAEIRDQRLGIVRDVFAAITFFVLAGGVVYMMWLR